MTFRKGNQKIRRRVEKIQAGIPHPLRTVPPLPSSSSVYLAQCITRPGRHDCNIYCESKIVGVYSHTTYLYVLDRHRLLVELWKKTVYRENLPTKHRLEWRRPDYRPISQYNHADKYPSPPPGGEILREPYPGVGTVEHTKIRGVCEIRTLH